MLPNKLSSYFLNIERPYPLKVSGKLKIGFIGYFRYPNTVLRFARLIGEYFPNIEFHFFGTGEEIILNRVNSLSSRYSNIFNNGPFVNPTDLPQIYNSIDLVACNYDTSTINERIAEPNKLYEAIFFNKPLIVSSNTYLASKVKQLQCGYIIDSSNDKDIIEFLESITADSIYSIAMNESMIQKTDIMESCVELFEKIHVYDI
jgi:glycosyltransferase involved in cell wall biosynthesis